MSPCLDSFLFAAFISHTGKNAPDQRGVVPGMSQAFDLKDYFDTPGQKYDIEGAEQ